MLKVMKSKYWLVLILCLGLNGILQAQTFKVDKNEVIFKSSQGDMRIQMCNDKMFRVTKSPNTFFPENEEWMVVKYDFDRVDYQVKAVTNGNEITTSSLKILVLSNPWRISVKNTDDTLIYKETAFS